MINRVPKDYNAGEAQAVMPQWNMLTAKWKANDGFVASYVFPTQGLLVSHNGNTVKNIKTEPGELKIVSTIIIKALSLEDAVEMAKCCPILQQDGSVEVIELMKKPG